jgi:type VI protein secretion system component Hcp
MRSSLMLSTLTALIVVVALPITAKAGSKSVQHREMTVTKHIDTASPKLFRSTAKGKHIPEAKLYVR